MGRYQIRLEQGVLEDLLEELAVGSWEAVKPYLTSAEPAHREHFFRRIETSILQCVQAFRLCGLSNICVDLVMEAPLDPERKVPDVNPWDNVYHLFIHGDLNDFIDNVAFEGLQAIGELSRPGTRRKIFEAIQNTVRDVFRTHLFYNSVCGKTELCIYSSKAPVDVVKH